MDCSRGNIIFLYYFGSLSIEFPAFQLQYIIQWVNISASLYSLCSLERQPAKHLLSDAVGRGCSPDACDSSVLSDNASGLKPRPT